MNEENKQNIQQEDEKKINYVDLVMGYLMYWPWILACVIAALVIAFLYLKRIPPVYQTEASMLIRTDDNKSNAMSGIAQAMNMESMGLISVASDFNTEVKVLGSRNLLEHTIESLDTYIDQKKKTKLGYMQLYGISPVKVWTTPKEAAKMDKAKVEISLEEGGSGTVKATIKDIDGDKDDELEYEKSFSRLPIILSTKYGAISVTRVDSVKYEPMDIVATISDPAEAAMAMTKNITVEPFDKQTNVAVITLNDESKLRAKAFINRLAELYNSEANYDKNIAAAKTSEFINGRIMLIAKELGKTETEMAGFKKRAGLTDISTDAEMSIKNRSEYDRRKSDNDTQLRLIAYVRSFVTDLSHQNELIPLNTLGTGQDDNGLSQVISNYNDLIINRARLIRNSSESNTFIRDLDLKIKGMKSTILSTLASLERSARITQSRLDAEASKYAGQISTMPEDEKLFLNISRQRDFQSQLYLLLMQKREENAIRLAATVNNGKLIESPTFISKVSPKGSIFYLVALILGIALPCGTIYLKRMLAFCIESRADIEAITNIPIIGEVPQVKLLENDRDILIKENKNGLMEEVYRNLRTSMQFILKKGQKVILITSTTTGEGKSTTAGNIATSYAFLGKKVVVVGLDVRKPGLNKVFHLPTHNTKGITTYLSNPEKTDLMSLIQPSGISDNLSVLVAGPIPPNPTELVARPALDDAINILKQNFDIVILDTAPLSMMSDTPLIARTADITLFVCRENYTRKAAFSLINEARDKNRLPNINIVFNGIDMNSRTSGYYYGYGRYGYYNRYGYGYGKDYGEGYAHHEHKKKTPLIRKVLEKIFNQH